MGFGAGGPARFFETFLVQMGGFIKAQGRALGQEELPRDLESLVPYLRVGGSDVGGSGQDFDMLKETQGSRRTRSGRGGLPSRGAPALRPLILRFPGDPRYSAGVRSLSLGCGSWGSLIVSTFTCCLHSPRQLHTHVPVSSRRLCVRVQVHTPAVPLLRSVASGPSLPRLRAAVAARRLHGRRHASCAGRCARTHTRCPHSCTCRTRTLCRRTRTRHAPTRAHAGGA